MEGVSEAVGLDSDDAVATWVTEFRHIVQGEPSLRDEKY